MVKHSLSVFDHFVGLVLEGLKDNKKWQKFVFTEFSLYLNNIQYFQHLSQ